MLNGLSDFVLEVEILMFLCRLELLLPGFILVVLHLSLQDFLPGIEVQSRHPVSAVLIELRQSIDCSILRLDGEAHQPRIQIKLLKIISTIRSYLKSFIPIFDGVYGDLSTFSYQQGILRIQESLQVLWVLRLTGNCSQCLMPDNILLLFILYALPHELFILVVADLPQDEADLVLEQTCLSCVILQSQQLTEGFNAVLGLLVAHVVHDAVFLEKGQLLTEKTQIGFLGEHLLQVTFAQESLELGLGERGGRLHGPVVVETVLVASFLLLELLQGYLTSVFELLAVRVLIFFIMFQDGIIEVVGQGLGGFVPGQVVLTLV